MKFQKHKLKDFANIYSGYSFRTKIINNPEGNTFAIQMRDISSDHIKISQKPHKVYIKKFTDRHQLKHGDVLFTAKGSNNYAVFYDMEYSPAVAASAFFIIRPDKRKMLPEYLCQAINSSVGQNYLQSNLAGTYIPNINKSTLNEMRISVPPLEIQHKVVRFFKVLEREKELLKKTSLKRELIMNKLKKSIITGKLQFKNGK